jgi:hypothetical protein
MIRSAYIYTHITRKPAPAHDWKYLAFVRTHPCCACGRMRWVEAAHTGPHGLGQKAPDRDAVPLCVRCHRTETECLGLIGPGKFQVKWGICFREIVGELNAEFSSSTST